MRSRRWAYDPLAFSWQCTFIIQALICSSWALRLPWEVDLKELSSQGSPLIVKALQAKMGITSTNESCWHEITLDVEEVMSPHLPLTVDAYLQEGLATAFQKLKRAHLKLDASSEIHRMLSGRNCTQAHAMPWECNPAPGSDGVGKYLPDVYPFTVLRDRHFIIMEPCNSFSAFYPLLFRDLSPEVRADGLLMKAMTCYCFGTFAKHVTHAAEHNLADLKGMDVLFYMLYKRAVHAATASHTLRGKLLSFHDSMRCASPESQIEALWGLMLSGKTTDADMKAHFSDCNVPSFVISVLGISAVGWTMVLNNLFAKDDMLAVLLDLFAKALHGPASKYADDIDSSKVKVSNILRQGSDDIRSFEDVSRGWAWITEATKLFVSALIFQEDVVKWPAAVKRCYKTNGSCTSQPHTRWHLMANMMIARSLMNKFTEFRTARYILRSLNENTFFSCKQCERSRRMVAAETRVVINLRELISSAGRVVRAVDLMSTYSNTSSLEEAADKCDLLRALDITC
eukprot:gnl/TRDRNA2_/TRDRNA2_94380_c0_seq1.p1 gnl/TRDRNA2_/TRDRNA2_94380_c0~~gnl/TRDRNA2_/TRDRNA2_94380_c0_seq1.p1  ORF type:complete len:513 (+),score=57.15 gnl/TRDRNA2_/TRDRNA2_94380_c0_seq1:99-1637(+)